VSGRTRLAPVCVHGLAPPRDADADGRSWLADRRVVPTYHPGGMGVAIRYGR